MAEKKHAKKGDDARLHVGHEKIQPLQRPEHSGWHAWGWRTSGSRARGWRAEDNFLFNHL